MAQLYLQKTDVAEALNFFRRAVELARTEYEMVNALSYAEATACQLRVQTEYPDLIPKIKGTQAGGPMF
jgi:mitochondrial import receptor subunit TOM70